MRVLLISVILAGALLTGCAAQGPSAEQIRAGITPAQITQASGPVLLAEVPGSHLAATMQHNQTRDGVETWKTGGNQTLSFRSGVLIQTRGLGDDLMGADVAGTLAALQGGPQADYPRLLSYLDGENRTILRAMTCAMSAPEPAQIAGIGTNFATRLRAETCHTTGLSVTNLYWQDADGTMRRSKQWIGPGLGMLVTELLTHQDPAP